tara:strand:+ start:682 stop:1014 length:333 start_codon:yes stop_codon:yes gene_type:complete
MNPNSKEYKNQEMKLRALSKLHLLLMTMLSTLAQHTDSDDEYDEKILKSATEATASVMSNLCGVMFETDNNITEEDIFEVFDHEWKRAVNEQSASYNIIGRNIDRMMGLS